MAGGQQDGGDYIMDDIVIRTNSGESYNINNLVIELNIYESIIKPCMSGNVLIEDGTGLIESGPIVGQEHIMFSLASSTDHDIIDFTEYHGVITEVAKRETANVENTQNYLLYFNTMEAVRNQRTKVSQSYNANISTTVLDIMKDVNYINCAKKINFEPTLGVRDYVFPNIMPLACIHLMSQEAISINNGSGYMFFENHNGFNFRTWGSLLQTSSGQAVPSKRTYVHGPSLPHDEKRIKNATLLNFEMLSSQSTWDSVPQGMFSSTLIKHDIFNKNYNVYQYNYLDDFNNRPHSMDTKISGPLVNKSPIDESNKSIGEYYDSCVMLTSSGSPKLFTDGKVDNQCDMWSQSSLVKRAEQNYFINRIVIMGDSSLAAGDIIELRIPSSMPGKPRVPTADVMERFLSGRYIAESIRHKVNIRTKSYNTVVECVKDSVFPVMEESDYVWNSERKQGSSVISNENNSSSSIWT